MEAITTLEQLRYNLTLGPGYEGYPAMIKAIDLGSEELEKVCYWKDDRYTRIRIYDTDCVEGLITCWPAGEEGPIHNYELQQGWVKVLKGELVLEYFRINPKVEMYSRKVIPEGEYAYLNDSIGYHRFANRSDQRSVALHVYSDKITAWHQFDEATGTVSLVQTSCDIALDE